MWDVTYLMATFFVSPNYYRFLGPSNPVSLLLEIIDPFLKSSIPRFRLSVAHYLLHSSSACLPYQLASKIIFLMGKKKPGLLEDLQKGKRATASSEDVVSDVYLDWRSNLSEKDVEHLRSSYCIMKMATIRILGKQGGANPSLHNHETMVYEAMFKVRLTLLLPPMIRKLFAELNLASSQIKLNG